MNCHLPLQHSPFEDVFVLSSMEMLLLRPTAVFLLVLLALQGSSPYYSGKKLLFLYNFVCASLYIKDRQEKKKTETLLPSILSLIPENEM